MPWGFQPTDQGGSRERLTINSATQLDKKALGFEEIVGSWVYALGMCAVLLQRLQLILSFDM